MSLSKRTQERLYNWKFDQAKDALEAQDEEATEQETALISSLADMLGDPGWFHGSLAVVVEVALEAIGIDKEKW